MKLELKPKLNNTSHRSWLNKALNDKYLAKIRDFLRCNS